MFKNVVRGAVIPALAVALLVPQAAAAQESKSAPLARQLVQMLEASKLDSIGAEDPANQAFVAALHIPGAQLLVVSGKFDNPAYGTNRLEKREFRELYMDLMGGAIPTSRLVASDVRGDGFAMKPGRDAPADTWQAAATTQAFEGARQAKMSNEEYEKAYAAADAEYARILEILLAQVKPKGGGSEVAEYPAGGLN